MKEWSELQNCIGVLQSSPNWSISFLLPFILFHHIHAFNAVRFIAKSYFFSFSSMMQFAANQAWNCSFVVNISFRQLGFIFLPTRFSLIVIFLKVIYKHSQSNKFIDKVSLTLPWSLLCLRKFSMFLCRSNGSFPIFFVRCEADKRLSAACKKRLCFAFSSPPHKHNFYSWSLHVFLIQSAFFSFHELYEENIYLHVVNTFFHRHLLEIFCASVLLKLRFQQCKTKSTTAIYLSIQ